MDKTIVALAAIAVVIIAAILLLPTTHQSGAGKVTVESTTSITQAVNTLQSNQTNSSTQLNSTTTMLVRTGHPAYGANATNAATTISTTTINYTINSTPQNLTVLVKPNHTIADVGEPIIFYSKASGGKPDYTYQWYLNSQPISGANGTTLNVTQQATGFFQYYLSVTDATNRTATSGFITLIVNQGMSADYLSTIIHNVSAGGSSAVSASASVSGGSPPYTYCIYQQYPAGSQYATLGYVTDYCISTNSTTESLYLSPRPVFGTYQYYLNVTDANNATVSTDNSTIAITYTNST